MHGYVHLYLCAQMCAPEGRGRAGKEGRRLWGPIPGEIVPGLCLSIPLNKESVRKEGELSVDK